MSSSSSSKILYSFLSCFILFGVFSFDANEVLNLFFFCSKRLGDAFFCLFVSTFPFLISSMKRTSVNLCPIFFMPSSFMCFSSKYISASPLISFSTKKSLYSPKFRSSSLAATSCVLHVKTLALISVILNVSDFHTIIPVEKCGLKKKSNVFFVNRGAKPAFFVG